jgi:hypothetical protein
LGYGVRKGRVGVSVCGSVCVERVMNRNQSERSLTENAKWAREGRLGEQAADQVVQRVLLYRRTASALVSRAPLFIMRQERSPWPADTFGDLIRNAIFPEWLDIRRKSCPSVIMASENGGACRWHRDGLL